MRKRTDPSIRRPRISPVPRCQDGLRDPFWYSFRRHRADSISPPAPQGAARPRPRRPRCLHPPAVDATTGTAPIHGDVNDMLSPSPSARQPARTKRFLPTPHVLIAGSSVRAPPARSGGVRRRGLQRGAIGARADGEHDSGEVTPTRVAFQIPRSSEALHDPVDDAFRSRRRRDTHCARVAPLPKELETPNRARIRASRALATATRPTTSAASRDPDAFRPRAVRRRGHLPGGSRSRGPASLEAEQRSSPAPALPDSFTFISESHNSRAPGSRVRVHPSPPRQMRRAAPKAAPAVVAEEVALDLQSRAIRWRFADAKCRAFCQMRKGPVSRKFRTCSAPRRDRLATMMSDPGVQSDNHVVWRDEFARAATMITLSPKAAGFDAELLHLVSQSPLGRCSGATQLLRTAVASGPVFRPGR